MALVPQFVVFLCYDVHSSAGLNGLRCQLSIQSAAFGDCKAWGPSLDQDTSQANQAVCPFLADKSVSAKQSLCGDYEEMRLDMAQG